MRKVIVIAEAGVNHNGSLDIAIELIKAAAKSGADYIKFQTFITELNISRTAKKAQYQLKNTKGIDDSQFEMVKNLELSFENFAYLNTICKQEGIGFLSTAFDLPSLDFIDSLNPDYLKIPSGEITNKLLLEQIALKQRKIILSTGMSDLNEIRWAINILEKNGLNREEITVLHCNTEYPTPFQDVNLKAMNTIANELEVKIGYSDHTLGIEVPIAAVAMGATIIEKHFTLSKEMSGPDHIASLEPDEMTLMINGIRNIEKAISGSGLKEVSASELKNIQIARKSIHIIKDLDKGSILQRDDLVMLRPGDGISPIYIDNVIGKAAIRNLKAGAKITWKDLE
jgi:N-acetylneuraminate synthase/N,N'-diacetyllegionaminate synthase